MYWGEDLEQYYKEHFSLACLNTDISNKFALISLICFLTKQARVKKPNATCAQVIKKVIGEYNLNSKGLLTALAIICEDYMYTSGEFMTFNIKSSKEMIAKINEILSTELPFDNPYNECPF